jgi:hypothetical protein
MKGCAAALLLASLWLVLRSQEANVGWAYNGGPQGDHYSLLTQLTPPNAGQLREE